MPIDPNIVLQQRPPAGIDLASAYQKAAALQNQQQVNQENQLKLQQQQDDELERQKIKRAYIESDGDPDNWLKRAKRYGIGPVGVRKIETMLSEKRKEALSLDESERKAMLERHDRIRAMMAPIDDEKDDAKAARMFAQAYQIADSQGLIDDKTRTALQQAMPQGFDREAFKVIKNSLTTGTKLMQEAEKETRAQATMLRAQAYQQNLQQRVAQTDFKNETERKKLELDIKEYEMMLGRYTDLDEVSRMRLRQELEIAKLKISQAREQEAGRNRRFDKGEAGRQSRFEQGEAGKDARMAAREAAITARVKAKGEKVNQASVQKNLTAAERLARRLNPDWEDLDEETQEGIINDIFDSFLENQPVAVTTTQDKDALFPDKAKTVKPNGKTAPVVNPKTQTPQAKPQAQPAGVPAGSLPPEIIAQMKVGVVTTLSDGTKWVKNPDGTVTKASK